MDHSPSPDPSSLPEVRERIAQGLERSAQLLDSVHRQQGSFQHVIEEQRRDSRFQRWLLVAVVGLLIVLILATVWHPRGANSASTGEDQATLIAELSERVRELEALQRSQLSVALLDSEGASGPEDSPRVEPTALAKETPSNYSFKPELPTQTSRTITRSESLAVREKPGTNVDRTSRPVATEKPPPVNAQDAPVSALEEPTEDVDASTRTEENPFESAADDLSGEDQQFRDAVNQLLGLAGVTEFRCLAGEWDLEKGVFTNVVLVQNDRQGSALGTVSGEQLQLAYDASSRKAILVLNGARGKQSGMDVEYPSRRLTIDLPGTLPANWIGVELQALLQDPESLQDQFRTIGAKATTAEQLNHVLVDLEQRSLRVRQVEAVDGTDLLDVIVDLEFNPAGKATKTLHADKLNLILDEKNGFIELHCEGGVLIVDGQSRPLFRGRYRQVLQNAQIEAWKALGLVSGLEPPSSP